MKWLVSFLAMSCIVGAAHAQTPPDVLVKNVTNEVLDIVRKDKDIQAGNARKAAALVEAKVLPNFNFPHMTQLALGANWRKASADQQKALIAEFKTLLVRTYSTSLTQYRKQTIDFKPFTLNPGDTDVRVRTQIVQSGAKPIPLDYSLEKQGAAWKVYDIEVSGISLIANYRGSFAEEINKGGVDGLIATLQAKNRAGGDLKK